jgi:hypothetical protein
MAQAPTIDSIRASRDIALSALNDAFNTVGREVARTTQPGPYLDRLTNRYDALGDEREAILAAATDAALALPDVVAAAATLASLASQMNTTAAALPMATDVLTKSATVLSLGQQFVDTIATAQKA